MLYDYYYDYDCWIPKSHVTAPYKAFQILRWHIKLHVKLLAAATVPLLWSKCNQIEAEIIINCAGTGRLLSFSWLLP